MRIEIRELPFDPWDELKACERDMQSLSGQFGATASFVGTMRDFNEGDNVKTMQLEHYPGMTESSLEKIAADVSQQYETLDTLIIHRVGEINPGDSIVLVAVWTAHRAAAFKACRELMEQLKSKAPFWKKETLSNSERWVEKNTPG